MRRHYGSLSLAAAAAVIAMSGCDAVAGARSRFGTTDTLAVAGAGSGLMIGLQGPGTLGAGDEGVLRLSVTNQSDTTARNVRLELIVPGWAEPMPPRAGDREVSMTALSGGGTRFAYGMEDTPLAPGETQTIDQWIRVPAGGIASAPEAPLHRIVRARLLGADGEALAEVEGEIALDGAARLPAAAGDDVRRDRIGPVRIGMTSASLHHVAPLARDTAWTQAGVPQRGSWVTVGGGGRLLAVLSGDSVARIEVREPGVRTDERLGVGSSLAELRSAYGAACADVGQGAVVAWFAGASGIVFALDAPVPADAAQLRKSAARLPDTARVTRWWVGPDVDGCPR